MNCIAMTKSGQPCRAAAQHGKDFCFLHDPTNGESVAAARRKGGRARRDQLAGVSVGALRTADEVASYLASTIKAVEQKMMRPAMGRAIAKLCRTQLGAIAAADFRAQRQRNI
jgi:hypothetical protein